MGAGAQDCADDLSLVVEQILSGSSEGSGLTVVPGEATLSTSYAGQLGQDA